MRSEIAFVSLAQRGALEFGVMASRWDETWHRLREWTNDQARSERLAAQVLAEDGFSRLDPSHPLGGKDGGADALCERDGRVWVMAVYFPRGQQEFRTIRDKFQTDASAAKSPGRDGIVFVTNQELRLAERRELAELVYPFAAEIFHLERVTLVLDKPAMAGIRKQFLGIDSDPSSEPRHYLEAQRAAALERRLYLREVGLSDESVAAELLDLKRLRRNIGAPARGQLVAGRYVLAEAIGRGGFGCVWRAVERNTRRQLAIKILHTHLAEDSVAHERFLRGARLMRDLQHDSVVPVYDFGTDNNGLTYLVMRDVAGSNLQTAITTGRLHGTHLLDALAQVASALRYAHSAQVIHRDVKPLNILIDEERRAYVTDFDLAWAVDTTGGTRTGAMGSFVYAAPEVIANPAAADDSCDVYSFGMTILYCLLGRELPLEVVRNSEPLVNALACSEGLKSMIRRAVSFDRAARPSIKAIRECLLRESRLEPVLGAAQDRSDYLVWVRTQQRIDTYWIAGTDKGVLAIARRPACVLSGGTRLWYLEEARVPVAFAGNHQFDASGTNAMERPKRVAGEIDTARLIDMATGEVVDLVTAEPSADEPLYVDASQGIRVEASFGHYAFVTTRSWTFGARAAHPYGGAAFRCLDLLTGASHSWIEDSERAELMAAEGAAAVELFRRAPEPTLLPESLSKDLEVTRCEVGYSRAGELELRYQFTVPDSYALGDKVWGDYTRSVTVSAHRIPALFLPHAQLPATVRQFIASDVGDVESYGWTSIDPTNRDAMLRLFKESRGTRAFATEYRFRE